MAKDPLTLLKTTFLAPLALDKILFFPIYFTLLQSAYYVCNILLILIVQVRTISSLTSLSISFLNSCQLIVEVLPVGLGFTYLGVLGVHISLSCY